MVPHRKKKVQEFPVPSRDVTTKLSLGGNNDVTTKLFLPNSIFNLWQFYVPELSPGEPRHLLTGHRSQPIYSPKSSLLFNKKICEIKTDLAFRLSSRFYNYDKKCTEYDFLINFIEKSVAF
jgi:hypothetical protein